MTDDEFVEFFVAVKRVALPLVMLEAGRRGMSNACVRGKVGDGVVGMMWMSGFVKLLEVREFVEGWEGVVRKRCEKVFRERKSC